MKKHITEKNKEFYRYESVQYASIDYDGEYVFSKIPNPKVVLRTYFLHKETPKGYWIGHGFPYEGKLRGFCKWVSKTSVKRYAYPTKKEALDNFIKRTEKRIKILDYQLMSCHASIARANDIKKYRLTEVN